MTYTAHVDTFARDHLPPAEAQPEYLFDLPELQFPERLNCATELLDRHVQEGRGDRRCVSAPGGPAWTYAELQTPGRPHRPRAGRRVRPRARQPRAAARRQQADARRLLVRGDEGGRHRRRDDADAARQGAEPDHREGPGDDRPLRRGAARRARGGRGCESRRPRRGSRASSASATPRRPTAWRRAWCATTRRSPTSTPPPTTPACSPSPRAPPASRRRRCTSTAT